MSTLISSRAPEAVLFPNETVATYILRMAQGGRRTAFIEQGAYLSRAYSYEQVAERSLAVGERLHARGLPGERVILWARPGARWAMSFYGCVLAGAVVVPIDAGFSVSFLRRVAEHTGASLVIGDAEMLDRLPPDLETPRLSLDALDALPAAGGWRPAEAARDTLAEIVYTSGTTAEPRGVMITHGNLLANLEPVEQEIEKYRWLATPFRPLRFLHLIPLSHLFGQVMALFIPQLLQGVVIFPENQAPSELARVIRDRRVSVMVGVPQQLEALGEWAAPLATSGPRERMSLLRRWWKHRRLHRELGWKMWTFVVGGAALPEKVERLWNEFGYAVIQGYGLTETAPAITITHPFKIRRGSVGKRLAGVEMRIAEDGEILVHGPNVSPGYYRNPEGSRQADGWLRTGDLGKLDAEGNLTYLGRKKEMIVTAEGLNVFPADVEQVLLAEPTVREAAIVARESESRPLVHAVLAPQPGAGEAEMSAAVAHANERLEPHQRIRGFSIWPEPSLPRTLTTLKLQRTAIAAWVNQGQAPAPLAAQRGSDWRGFLERLGHSGEHLRPGARLSEDIGLSSLDRVEWLTWLENAGYTVDEERFSQAADLASVEQALVARDRSPAAGEPDWPGTLASRMLRDVAREAVLFPVLSWYVSVDVAGAEKLDALSPPVIFVSNHQSLMDVPVILRGLPLRFRRTLAPAMGVEHFTGRPGLLALARLFFHGYLLSPDARAAHSALRHAGRLAEAGYSTLIFPEGRHTPDGRVHAFRPGIGVMAAALRIPVVPLHIDGLFEIWPRHQPRSGRGKVTLQIGDSLLPGPGETAAQFTGRLESFYGGRRPESCIAEP